MLQVELNFFRLRFRLGGRLPGGPQSGGGALLRGAHLRGPDRLLFRQSRPTLDVFSLVCFQPLHRALRWSACHCLELPVEVRPHWPFGPQTWGCRSSPCRLSHWVWESLQRHFVKLVVAAVLVHSRSQLFLWPPGKRSPGSAEMEM